MRYPMWAYRIKWFVQRGQRGWATSKHIKVGDEFGWTTVGGDEHYGTVTDIDSNVVYVWCEDCGREVCTEQGWHDTCE